MEIVKCPICHNPLFKQDNTYQCHQHHSFDIAKQGYVNLLQKSSKRTHGDSKEMLEARKYVQYKGLYEDISVSLIDSLSPYIKANTKVLDIGSGIGYYLDMLQEKYPMIDGYGIDISKEGVRFASRKNKKLTYLVASNKELPILSQSIDIITSVFSPYYLEEVKRVLKKDGIFITLSPGENHLIEIKRTIYDTVLDKDYSQNRINDAGLSLLETKNIQFKIILSKEDISNVFLMTPHYWTSTVMAKKKLLEKEKLAVTIDIILDMYRLC